MYFITFYGVKRSSGNPANLPFGFQDHQEKAHYYSFKF
jgi:hypothetical protein